ncbi:hypothetical protein B0A49_00475 [Cryomyces minteri]|uniref:SEC7 domain-containing protein n=1 Tax=Cryomyces minteri TaxID=331657 RepID=A0A4U0XW25_9PEZI|nr:hypothetical protein B0A49_00475 [Cryomyces minteri]
MAGEEVIPEALGEKVSEGDPHHEASRDGEQAGESTHSKGRDDGDQEAISPRATPSVQREYDRPTGEASPMDSPSLDIPEHTPSQPKSADTQSIPSTAHTPEPQTPRTPRQRTESQSIAATTTTQRSSTRSSMVFVVTALETIAASKDARKRKPLGDATQRALSTIKSEGDPTQTNPEILFLPLRLATEASAVAIVTVALDCIGKLISYSYFSVPSETQTGGPQAPPLIERAIDTICDCFQGEATPVEVQLQIIKSLLAAILNDKIIVHGAGLLKAVRQTYNIFLLSKSSANQQIAQGTLTQMIATVFERVKVRLAMKETRVNASNSPLGNGVANGSAAHLNGIDSPDLAEDGDGDDEIPDSASLAAGDRPVEKENQPKITLQSFENRKSFDDDRIRDNEPTMVTRVKKTRVPPRSASGTDIPVISVNQDLSEGEYEDEEDEFFIKDAFLVFRAMCKLSTKQLRGMLKKEIEVFLKEIYLAILDKRAAPVFQKQYIMTVLGRLSADPRALVEIYLNYDCDRTALDNMYQRVIEHISRISSTPVPITALQQFNYQEQHTKSSVGNSDWQTRGILPPSLSTATLHSTPEVDQGFPPELALKQQSLECLVETLRSMVNWAQQGIADSAVKFGDPQSRNSVEDLRESLDTRENGVAASPHVHSLEPPAAPGTPIAEDDPEELERVKRRKRALDAAIRRFNEKPKRGLKVLLSEGFIKSDSPEDIATFLISHDQLDKKALGEFLGEGEVENIAIMHAFVDSMDFAKTRFVDALRRFLQSFRLPGEAQKIDRFMLKFAERYITGNPNAFANADTAYVLAYSVIMLNTDQHSVKMKGRRMTPEDFIKNNRGINDSADLPDEYLRGIYDEIAHNEIVLDTEREIAANLGMASQPAGGFTTNISQVLATVGRDLQREAFAQASEEMANKTEQRFKPLLKAQRRGASKTVLAKYIPATSFKHVGPMFEETWMSFLTALSGQAQESNDLETIKLCMEGQRLAIRIACLFDLENPRQAFVASLARFTNLYNLSEMKAKNIEALKILLEVAQHEGNLLKESWRDILTCISQLDRFQLISTGVNEEAVPDVLRTHVQPRGPPPGRRSLQVPNRPPNRSSISVANYRSEIAEESRSAEMIRGVDRIFTNTANLSGDAIVHSVKALTQVSWQEIQSSGQSDSPRTYSLQKLVEISGYNMTRVRFEWTNIWQVLGEHFNQVGCHSNTNVVYFALNSLRQLSMRFMEIEELPGFKFQKDFLKPFEHIMSNATQVQVKDMVLQCLNQMIQARGQNIRSGWRTMFGVFTVAAREPYENIVNLAFNNVTDVYNSRFGVVISQGAFADLVVCLTEFSKNMKFQKKSLQAIETLKASVPKMLRTPECPLSIRSTVAKDAPQAGSLPKQPSRQTQEEQYWFPVLFAFHDVLMTGEDLEVRSRALNYLFDTLIKYGRDFPQDFWDTLWRQLLYPIFMVLKSKSEMSKVLNHEELSVWLSTTMIQALRNMISLFTHFFESLEYMLDRFLDLLGLCICQENDTLARIGSNCLQQLILQNVTKFNEQHWNQIVGAFVDLFNRTEATALFSAATSSAFRKDSSTSTNGRRESMAPSTATGDSKGISDLPLSQTPTEDQNTYSLDNALGINGLSSSKPTSVVTGDTTTTTSSTSLSSTTNRSPSPRPSVAPSAELEDYRPTNSDLQQAPVVVTAARRRFFNQIITKCVLQLLMIETVNELFSNDAVYTQIPSHELLRLMALLKKSYHFAKRFNGDRDLRSRLFREGFMKQPPNLLKQESGSAAVYISILLRMYHDTGAERTASRPQTEAALIPLCVDIITSYNQLDEETQQRNIVTWRPVVVDVLEGYATFPEAEFSAHVETFAPLVVNLMGREMGVELQKAVQGLVQRVFEVKLGLPPRVEPLPTPTSPRASVFAPRRGSRGR